MVKCQDCGFLSLRVNETQALVETPEGTRQSGQLTHRSRHAFLPECFVKACSFRDEWNRTTPEHEQDQARLRLYTTERDCKSWVKWQEGLTPREHKEMVDQQTLREWQEERRRNDRDWQEAQRKGDQDRQRTQRKEDQDRQDGQRRSDRIWAIVLLIVGAVLGWLLKQ